MKPESKKNKNLGIIIPGSAVLSMGLYEEDILEIHVKEGNMIIVSKQYTMDNADLVSK